MACKYASKCWLYSETSETCKVGDRYCGQFRKFEDEKCARWLHDQGGAHKK